MIDRNMGAHVTTPKGFQEERSWLASKLLAAVPFDRGEVHAQKVTSPEMVTIEIPNFASSYRVGSNRETWKSLVSPNLPWAEDHFLERVGGKPLNPPPSHTDWPFNRQGNQEHLIDGEFSHTYPERFWPKWAGY